MGAKKKVSKQMLTTLQNFIWERVPPGRIAARFKHELRVQLGVKPFMSVSLDEDGVKQYETLLSSVVVADFIQHMQEHEAAYWSSLGYDPPLVTAATAYAIALGIPTVLSEIFQNSVLMRAWTKETEE